MGGVLPCCRPIDRSGRILFLGPRQSGKTSALFFLKNRTPATTVPTHGYNVERLVCGKHEYDVYEIGGAVNERQDCLFLMATVAAVVFFIDLGAGEKGLNQALQRLEIMLAEKALRKCPVAIAANKVDLCDPGRQVTRELKELLREKSYMKYRYWRVFPCEGRTGRGLDKVLAWCDKNVGHFVKVKKQRRKAQIRHHSVLRK